MAVYESQRKESNLDFYSRAVDIRAKITKLVTSEKVVKKSARFVFSVPMAETARQLVYHVITGMEFYPSSEENVQARKRFYTLAIADCKMLQEDMKCLIELTNNTRPSAFSEVQEMLDAEVADLKSKRKNTRIRGNQV